MFVMNDFTMGQQLLIVLFQIEFAVSRKFRLCGGDPEGMKTNEVCVALWSPSAPPLLGLSHSVSAGGFFLYLARFYLESLLFLVPADGFGHPKRFLRVVDFRQLQAVRRRSHAK